MSLSNEASTIMQQLIRNRFDALSHFELMISGPMLINIAEEEGFDELAAQMEQDLRMELPPQVIKHIAA